MADCNDYIILAERDYKTCLLAEREFPDEYAVAAAAYHIQQAVEKVLKGLILIYGETPEFTHNIAKLCVHLSKSGIDLPEELEDISDTLTAWESNLRYDPFINFSEKKYNAAKKIYCELSERLKREISLIKSEE
ncbi:MAG: HEPN domain-containing protein [Ruminococcus sp.]|nr:HEPN domain-containing protein [Ruminococcus sp.]MCM1382184.1 HEPN domain-containing protein [Muribaculaceae bacterium]MCM1480036.1 HEPN domain-containing protein [Muribaculaceae bacterium]